MRAAMKIVVAVTGVVLMIVLTACSTVGKKEPVNAAAGTGVGKSDRAQAGAYRYGQQSADGPRAGAELTGNELNATTGPLSQRVIYFAYDSDDVLPEYQAIVTAHADYLAVHSGRKAILEGHADERGSSEYNIALGERRAKSVERSMRLQGAGEGQLSVVSYGEEKPAVSGHEESTWQQNRRVEIVYSGH